ncbi:4-alpha-glucanotransferase [Leptospira perolatii]|uniref:4-alpha-glucanotransferase n=1 Tax=Leptospira perolatii TaxID=2023191 RepID=A0A2M9ZI40_9LEPT|nr:4-alpha-glucanotransferase [Leptospira perolatii]PJZ69682.1 4-alpha-glucanotransferase [Leptospira perolatii]PJZ71634.1 4-alpha-glucanotransferase [Leptospira perolatii]
MNPALSELASFCGIAPEYYDLEGKLHELDERTALGILKALGIDSAELSNSEWAFRKRERERISQVFEPTYFFTEEHNEIEIQFRWPLSLDFGETECRISLEDGSCLSFPFSETNQREEKDFFGYKYAEYRLLIPRNLPQGYHQISLEKFSAKAESLQGTSSLLVVHPSSCFTWTERRTGISAQLYSLRTPWNDGIGDFNDLLELGKDCTRNGFSVLGMNPLHSLFSHLPNHRSPYSPSNRLFRNPIYIHIPWLFENLGINIKDSEYSIERESPIFKNEKSQDCIDYDLIFRFKFKYFQKAFLEFSNSKDDKAIKSRANFKEFQEREGSALFEHCLFESLCEKIEGFGPNFHPGWPKGFENYLGESVSKEVAANQDRIEFFQFLQWEAERQLTLVNEHFNQIGLALYLDLAVAPHPQGSEVWSNRELYSSYASIGAPPDHFSPEGQNWGISPILPQRLRQNEYILFRKLLQKNMIFGGALRIDHALGLFKLFWIPEGAKVGGYVNYPWQDLLKLIALESQRNRCLVIGEDLGNVPEEVKINLMNFGIYSWKVLIFEKDASGQFKPLTDYPWHSVATHNTHDLPTLKGYLVGADIHERVKLGQISNDQYAEMLKERKLEEQKIFSLYRQVSAQNEISSHTEAPISTNELLSLLDKCNSQILLYSLGDILEETEQPNLPGTVDEYPNWKLRYRSFWKTYL